MYRFLLILIIISIFLFICEMGYVLLHIKSKMHGFLFFYLMSCLINNAGYLCEMVSTTMEGAYTATRLLYVGKVFIAFSLFIFVFFFCKVEIKNWVIVSLFLMHNVFLILILTNNFHHLYYSSVSHVYSGLFPHNVYGHGPVYFVFQILQVVYLVIAAVVAIRASKKFSTREEKIQIAFLVGAPSTATIGLVVFMTGVTKGFDTTNIGLCISSVAMMYTLFRYKLVDTEELVKGEILDSFDDGIIALDASNNLAYMNNSTHDIFPDLGEGQELKELLRKFDSCSLLREKIEISDKIFEIHNKRLYQGKIYRGSMYILDDVTELSKHNKELREAKERADRANKAKSDFLSNMSHEIRTPMNAVVGMTEILLRDENLSDSQKFYLDNILNSGKALIEIINDILDFSKIESGKFDIVEDDYEVHKMLSNLEVVFNTRIGDKPVELIYNIDKKLPYMLRGDAVRIRQVVINLMNNAIKFTDKGYVKMHLDVMRVDDEKINLRIIIQDTGIGIKPEDLSALYKSFTQLDAKKNHYKEGTGLGLAISKQLVELMGGTIEVDSEYGVGTTFVVVIPQKIVKEKADVKAIDEEKKEIDLTLLTGKNILIAEDNKVNAEVAKGLLAPLKMNISFAQNGLEAYEKIRAFDYDLVLMDHMMPIMDGVEATKKVRELPGDKYRKIPIIALTANAVSGARDMFFETGMNDFVSKPIDYNEICGVLSKWMPN